MDLLRGLLLTIHRSGHSLSRVVEELIEKMAQECMIPVLLSEETTNCHGLSTALSGKFHQECRCLVMVT